MTLDDIRNIDPQNIGSAPLPIKVGLLVILVAGVIGFGYWYFWQERMKRLEEVTAKEDELRQEFETKQQRAANLEKYKQQLEQMREQFGDMLEQLPSAAEVSDLLNDVSNEVLASGLQQELFKPQQPVQQDFYAEQPVQLRVKGKYDELGRFVSGVANMPRIVTLDGIAISRNSEGSGDDEGADLSMQVTAKTYWYREPGDN
jgi:type IV pilus assembly protein PilO